MSNRRKITRVKIQNTSAEVMYETARHAELVLDGDLKLARPTLNRRIRRALRRTVPKVSQL